MTLTIFDIVELFKIYYHDFDLFRRDSYTHRKIILNEIHSVSSSQGRSAFLCLYNLY